MTKMNVQECLARFRNKDVVILGKILKEIEDQTALGYEILKAVNTGWGNGHIVGITGPPGAGKSTLVNQLAKYWGEQGKEIAIIAVDPTSPFSGGALLGDRIRMMDLLKYENIFIKSLATRGNLGGLTASTSDIVQLFDAYGKEIIIIETVGVGQVELDIMNISDTVILVNVPGLGDSIQTMKGGIMEIADLYAINQADRPGADESVRDLKMMIAEFKKTGWVPTVTKTVAVQGTGVAELAQEVERHRAYLQDSGLWSEKRKARNTKRLMDQVEKLFQQRLQDGIAADSRLGQIVAKVAAGELDPYTSAEQLFHTLFR